MESSIKSLDAFILKAYNTAIVFMLQPRVKSQLRSKIRWGMAGILALFLVSAFYDAPAVFNRLADKVNQATALGLPNLPEKPFLLGLDLQGGAHLIYQADVTEISGNERAAAVEGVRDVIERRVNGLGVSEPSIQTARIGDDYRILVELPGVTDIKQAIAMIGETPILEFREANKEPARALTPEEQKQLDDYNLEAKKRAEEALRKIKKDGLDFVSAVKEYSEDEPSQNNDGYFGFISAASPYTTLYTWAGAAKEGEISAALIKDFDGYRLARRGGQREGEGEVQARHILICYLGAERCDSPIYTKTEAKQKAQEIFNQANAANFAELAAQHSTDASNKNRGGDLGSFGRGAMVKPFAEAAFSAQVNQIVGPVETEFGYHIIYKTGEEKQPEYEVSTIFIRTRAATDILPPPEPYAATGLSGKQLERSEVVTNPQTGTVEVALQFNSEGKELFKQLTEKNLNQPLAIYLDGIPISIPTVQTVIPDGRAVIQGNFTLPEARLLTQRLNAGALPVPVELVSQQSVGATLGKDSLQKSLFAGLIGLLLVAVYMILYYRFPGLVAVAALAIYLSLSLAVFKLMGVTLTLSGIAGFILSIGMAVDANVLIFERLKEELEAGKSLRLGMEDGFLRAWAAIRDGNICTLIICAFLIWLGSSFVQGFAVTLAVGTLMSMFTAITITRVMMRFVSPWFGERGNRLFLGYRKPNI